MGLFKKYKQRRKQKQNRKGNKKKCYICNNTFNEFTKYNGGTANAPIWQIKLDVIGSDIDNFGCVFCGSNDRERHLYMFFDELNLWSLITNNEVIHFAPEKNLSPKIEEYSPSKYVKGDLYPANDTIQKIDLTNIPYEDETFGLFLCNHVLEHVPDYKKAMQEIFRVLRPGGTAILQTPYSKLLKNNFEDEGINTDELRLIFYGQEDHARYFSETQFLQSLMECGFELQIVKHSDLFDADKATYYGVNKNEDLIRVLKPSTK